MDTKNKIFVVVGTVAILAAAGVTAAVLFTKKDDESSKVNPPQTTSNTGTTPESQQTKAADSYKDGTYKASVSYRVPHGSNSLNATVVISSGKISSVKTDNSYTDRESAMFVSDFESALDGDATGQSISSYKPSRIGGASLTTEAFDEAISDIRSQAKA